MKYNNENEMKTNETIITLTLTYSLTSFFIVLIALWMAINSSCSTTEKLAFVVSSKIPQQL